MIMIMILIDDHYDYNQDIDNDYDYDHDGDHDDYDYDDNCHLTALLHLIFVEVGVKIIPQSPGPRSNCLESNASKASSKVSKAS